MLRSPRVLVVGLLATAGAVLLGPGQEGSASRVLDADHAVATTTMARSAAKRPAQPRRSTATTRTRATSKAPRGPRGRRGASGARGGPGEEGAAGAAGVFGPTGPAGAARVLHQPVSINWQNGRFSGRERVPFAIPGIGAGEVVCSRDAQMIVLRRADPAHDVSMWTAKVVARDDGLSPADTKEARLTQFTGELAHEGFNLATGALAGDGTYSGIIASAGERGAPGGPGPAPTTFRLTFHWRFGDPFGDRCYIAATFTTEVPA